MPIVPYVVKEIFNFIHSNSNLVTTRGMDGIITGLDKEKIFNLAEKLNLDLNVWYFAILIYEENLLRLQEENKNKK